NFFFVKADRHASVRSKKNEIVAVCDGGSQQFVAFIQSQRNNPPRQRIIELRQLAFLDHTVPRHHDNELGRSELLHRQKRLYALVRLQVDQSGNVLSLSGRPGIRNLVYLEPVDAPFVGEDQQIGVSGGNDQV